MKARHVARELALLNLIQINPKYDNIDELDIDELIINSIRTLCDYTNTNFKSAINDLLKIQEKLEEQELNDPINLKLPIEAKIKSVPIIDTGKLKNTINQLLESVEYIICANEIVEFKALAQMDTVREYAIRLIRACLNYQNDVDLIISKYSDKWQIDRLLKIDKNILRIAITEIEYFHDVPCKVSADEAVELSKKYSGEDSPSFINGILGQYLSEFNKELPKETETKAEAKEITMES